MFDEKSKIDITLIDLKKAFVSLNYDNLLLMLSEVEFGESVLAWLSNFLHKRFSNVKLGNG